MAKRDGILSSGLRLGVGLSLFAVALVGISSLGLLPSLPNPFGTDDVDRNRPVLLESLEDVSEYTAARGNFEVTVDTGHDARFFPDVILGDRTVLAAIGEVEATVDFSNLADGAIEVDGSSVTFTVPEPKIDEARIDNEQTDVINRERGFLNRIGGIFSNDPVDDQDLYIAAENKMQEAAADSELLDRARENTTKMLEGLAADLGFDDVTVIFERAPGDRA